MSGIIGGAGSKSGVIGLKTFADSFNVSFAVKCAATQTNVSATGSGTVVVFGTDIFDIGNNFDGTTFTAPVSGIYNFSTSVRMNQIPTTCRYAEVQMHFTGGPPLLQCFMSEPPQTGLYDNLGFTQIVNMDAGDTALVKVYYDGGSGLDIQSGDGTRFCGYLVR